MYLWFFVAGFLCVVLDLAALASGVLRLKACAPTGQLRCSYVKGI